MIVTEIYNGQGLGNQLWCYVVTRVIAQNKGYEFGIMHPEKLKCLDFLNLDFGNKVTGGRGPEGGPPISLPEGIQYYYREKEIFHPKTKADIRTHDTGLLNVQDRTKIDGYMQDEQYIIHRKKEITEWLRVKKEFECVEFANDNICIINFRGGEYVGIREVFLPQKYWDDAISVMKNINPLFKFVVITDDTTTAKKFFPEFPVYHFSIGKDYSIINNSHYLIMANSSFSFFPTWTNIKLKYCIAPKYWSQYNTSDGYWGMGYNVTKDWIYMDRSGKLFNYEECLLDIDKYKSGSTDHLPPSYDKRVFWLWQRNMIRKIKKLSEFIFNSK